VILKRVDVAIAFLRVLAAKNQRVLIVIDSIKHGLKNFFTDFSAVVCLSLMAADISYASASLPSGIEVSVSVDRGSLSVDDEIWVNVSYRNVSDIEVALPKRETVLGGGMTEDLFSVVHNGVELKYVGVHVKRLAPIASDYVYLAPGQSASEKVDLLRSYPINYKGDYSISLRDSGVSTTNGLATKKSAAIIVSLNQDRLVRVLKRTPRFQNCSAGQRSEINAALTSAERIANESIRALQSAPLAFRPTSERYTEWFGAYTAERYAQVEQGMSRIASATSNQTIGFNCDCSNQPGVDPTQTFAFVFQNDAFNMTLCDVFFLVPREGTDSKSGTIVHEISHFNVVASTDDLATALGQRGSRNLANSSPASAIRNANAFEYFAENTPFLSVVTTDLSLSNVSLNREKLFISRPATIAGRIENLGPFSSSPTTIAMRLAGRELVAQLLVPAISGQASFDFELSFTAPSSAGDASYEICLSSIIGETNLANNCTTISGVEVIDGFDIAPILPLLLDD